MDEETGTTRAEARKRKARLLLSTEVNDVIDKLARMTGVDAGLSKAEAATLMIRICDEVERLSERLERQLDTNAFTL